MFIYCDCLLFCFFWLQVIGEVSVDLMHMNHMWFFLCGWSRRCDTETDVTHHRSQSDDANITSLVLFRYEFITLIGSIQTIFSTCWEKHTTTHTHFVLRTAECVQTRLYKYIRNSSIKNIVNWKKKSAKKKDW